MTINLNDNGERDKYILELFRTSPKEAFRLLFDTYHMKLCISAGFFHLFLGEEILFENKSKSSLLSLFVCAECGRQCFAEK